MSGVRATAAEICSGRLSALEVCRQALARAEEASELGAFWHIAADAALADAERLDRAIAAGVQPGRLAGVPVAVKDGFDVTGMPGGGGGPVRVAGSDAEAVRRLRDEGAVVLGKLAMHQLGWGMSGQTPGRPLCRNPYAPGRQPGGSSSGSAAAVAAGLVPLALGGDSGGSVRIPAAWCGGVGAKPHRAALPTAGLLPLVPRLDAVGLLTRTVDDCLLAEAAIRGLPEPSLPSIAGLRLGVERRFCAEADARVTAACDEALRTLAAEQVELVDAELPVRGLSLAPVYAAELAGAWEEEVTVHPARYGEDVREGVRVGKTIRAVDYLRALNGLEDARSSASLVLDALACPASPIPPPPLGAADRVQLAGRFARPFNLLDWPTIVVPCGSPEAPAGLQLAAPRGREAILYALAAAAERAREPAGV